jgi:membrane protease YdiL (CAAX protease family)
MTTLHNPPPGLVRRILCSPPARVLVLGFVLLLMMGLNTDVMTSYANDPFKAIRHIMALAIAGFAVYIGYARLVERRDVSELSLPGMGRELGTGLAVGAGLYAACELVLMALGIYRIDGLNPLRFMVPAIAMALSSSIFEELLFRGVLFRAVETWFGSWVALVVSSLVFGLTHLMNPQGTLEGALFIAVEAGTLLAAAYMLTRRLWLSIGFHMAWNYTQSAIFFGHRLWQRGPAGADQVHSERPRLADGGQLRCRVIGAGTGAVHHHGNSDADHGREARQYRAADLEAADGCFGSLRKKLVIFMPLALLYYCLAAMYFMIEGIT